ncbi:MAG: hypothetical protein ACOVO1_03730 [Chitinophagaceae bacterium]
MTANHFIQLSTELQQIVKHIPLQWGQTQNDVTDAHIKMFQIHSFAELEKQINHLTEESKNYFRRRWFLWKCAACDEYIFCTNENVKPNENKRSQAFDIEFNNDAALRFDLKGTLIPKQFRNCVEDIIANPKPMVDFFYQQQSKGVRESYYNRLFIVHHSLRHQEREMMLRCHFNFKKEVFKIYAQKLKTTSSFIHYQNAKADVIFIIENLDRSITYKINSISPS